MCPSSSLTRATQPSPVRGESFPPQLWRRATGATDVRPGYPSRSCSVRSVARAGGRSAGGRGKSAGHRSGEQPTARRVGRSARSGATAAEPAAAGGPPACWGRRQGDCAARAAGLWQVDAAGRLDASRFEAMSDSSLSGPDRSLGGCRGGTGNARHRGDARARRGGVPARRSSHRRRRRIARVARGATCPQHPDRPSAAPEPVAASG